MIQLETISYGWPGLKCKVEVKEGRAVGSLFQENKFVRDINVKLYEPNKFKVCVKDPITSNPTSANFILPEYKADREKIKQALKMLPRGRKLSKNTAEQFLVKYHSV